MIWTSRRNEMGHLNNVKQIINDENFAERVDYHLRWYIIEANRCKLLYYCLSIINIALPLVLEGINLCAVNNVDPIIKISTLMIPLIISFISSLITFSRIYDKWVSYRTTINRLNILLSEYIDAQNQDGFDDEKYKYHQKFNAVVNNENQIWELMQKDKKS